MVYRLIMSKHFLRITLALALLLGFAQVGSSTSRDPELSCSILTAKQIGTSVFLVGVVGTYSLLAFKDSVSEANGCL